MMYRARRMLQQASRFSVRFFGGTKEPEHGIFLRADSHDGLHPKQGKMIMLKNRFRELDDVYGDKSKPLSIRHSNTYDKYRMLKKALERGEFGQNATLLSPNASLEEAFKVVNGEKIDANIEVEAIDNHYVDWVSGKYR